MRTTRASSGPLRSTPGSLAAWGAWRMRSSSGRRGTRRCTRGSRGPRSRRTCHVISTGRARARRGRQIKKKTPGDGPARRAEPAVVDRPRADDVAVAPRGALRRARQRRQARRLAVAPARAELALAPPRAHQVAVHVRRPVLAPRAGLAELGPGARRVTPLARPAGHAADDNDEPAWAFLEASAGVFFGSQLGRFFWKPARLLICSP